MKRCLAVLMLTLLTSAPALAQKLSPKETVVSFYKDYRQAIDGPGNWMERLMAKQGDHLEKPLADWLLKLASGDPEKNEPFLDFDPFSNSQTGLLSYSIGGPSEKGGLVYVPVAMKMDGPPGPERVRARFVLRDSGQGWKIANVAYPAESGMEAWDLKAYLNELFATK